MPFCIQAKEDIAVLPLFGGVLIGGSLIQDRQIIPWIRIQLQPADDCDVVRMGERLETRATECSSVPIELKRITHWTGYRIDRTRDVCLCAAQFFDNIMRGCQTEVPPRHRTRLPRRLRARLT